VTSILSIIVIVYAPLYRAVQIESFMPQKFDATIQALDLAYQDVESAFDYYLTHYNLGGLFIVVGHSQSTTHALRLLEQNVFNTELFHQLVAAYLVGYWLPIDKFSRGFDQITSCEDAIKLGCIISYDVFGEDAELDVNVPHWYDTGWELSRQADKSVNPPRLCQLNELVA
jgi:hypothetical protein